MASDIQYRALGNGANLREEPSLAARVVTTLAPGAIMHLDPDRTTDVGKDGHHWLPVLFVRGWVREDMAEEVE